ncbi:beta-glucuronosyltransferase GlcAT14A isoform X2 [Setaria viridis]|uniref:beta-glucuronosyltransferase GlcAT14A isoform X2 n=1 Tax=Setaria viridis TaxID=4556 RepID=UPI003B3BBB08
MAMRARVMGLGGGRRELLVSAAFTALLVASILLLPSLLLTGAGAGPKSWPFLSSLAASDGAAGEAPRYPVSFAYLISASSGDAGRAARLLAALYHPANSYLLHLDREAPAEEHRRLAELVSGRGVYATAGNVWIVGRPNLVTYRGPTMLTTTLHAVALLLRLRRRWDWFVNLSASDYPLVTQDDMMEAFAGLPRDLNFIQHTSHLGWKIKKRARPVILDTALYEDGRAELLRPENISTNLRRFPTAFKLYTGSFQCIERPCGAQ